MADLEGIELNNIIEINNNKFAIYDGKAYNEYAKVVYNLDEEYPDLDISTLPDEATQAIIVADLTKKYGINEEEKAEGISITKESKKDVFDVIKGLRALGMNSSWFDVNGVRQMAPICTTSKSDLKEFTKIVQKSVNNDKNWLEVVLLSCKMNGVEAGTCEECVIDGYNCLLDVDNKKIYLTETMIELANIEDIKADIGYDASKVLLIQRAKNMLDEMNLNALLEEANEEDYDEDDYDEEDDEEEDW